MCNRYHSIHACMCDWKYCYSYLPICDILIATIKHFAYIITTVVSSTFDIKASYTASLDVTLT